MSVLIKRERFILGEDLELKEGLNTLARRFNGEIFKELSYSALFGE